MQEDPIWKICKERGKVLPFSLHEMSKMLKGADRFPDNKGEEEDIPYKMCCLEMFQM